MRIVRKRSCSFWARLSPKHMIAVRTAIISTLLLFVFSAGATRAEIIVEATDTIVDEQTSVTGWAYAWYPLPLEAGATIQVALHVSGGSDNAIQAWLVDQQNFQLLKAGQQFNIWPDASPSVTQQAFFSFTAPATSVYHLVLDNRASLWERKVTIQVNQNTGKPTEQSTALTKMYAARYEGLKNLFIFNDFDIRVKSCGQANAFSNPNITMCIELLQKALREGVPGAELTVFFHEVAHSLLNLWRYPGHDNEDTADELATMIMILVHEESAALEGAQYYAAQDSQWEASVKLVQDDRHSLSVQRARNIVNWLSLPKKEDLASRWLRVLIPHMTNTVLTTLINASPTPPRNQDQATIIQAMRDERQKRQNLAGN